MIIAGLRQSVRTSIQKNDTSMFLSPNKTQTTGGLSREAARLGIKTKNFKRDHISKARVSILALR